MLRNQTSTAAALAACILLALLPSRPLAADVHISFSNPLMPPTNQLPREALYPPGFQSTNYGPFSKVISGRVAAINVTWADPTYFPSEHTATEFLLEALQSTNSETAAFHVWSNEDGDPALTATIEHRQGHAGELRAWCHSGVRWAYHDGDGKWWWGYWQYFVARTNQVLATITEATTNPLTICETLRSAINQQDWKKLRAMAKPNMRANDYITQWESSARAGKDIKIGRPLRVEKFPDKDASGSIRETYAYEEWQDGQLSPHEFQVIVTASTNAPPTLTDFWTFGW